MYAQNTLENKQLPMGKHTQIKCRENWIFFLLPGMGQTYPRPGLEPDII